MRDAQAVGLGLAALARLDRERRARELDVVVWAASSSHPTSGARKNEHVIASGTALAVGCRWCCWNPAADAGLPLLAFAPDADPVLGGFGVAFGT